MRNDWPSGAAESEKGCDFHQRAPREKPKEKELAGAGVHAVEAVSGQAQGDDARAFDRHLGHPQAIPEGPEERAGDAERR